LTVMSPYGLLGPESYESLAGTAMLFELKNAFGVSPGTNPRRNST
jgi:hypothetical protein